MLRSWGAEPRKRQTPYTRLRPGRSHRAPSPWGEPSLTFFAKRNTSRPESGDTRGGEGDVPLRHPLPSGRQRGPRACGWTGGSGERRQGRGWWRKAPEGGGSRQHAPGPWHAGVNRWRRGRSPTGLRPHTILRRSLATIPGYSSTLTRIPLVYVNQFFRLKRVYGETFKPYVQDADQHTPGGPRCPLCPGPRRWPRSGTTAVPTSSLTSGSSCLSENFAHIERHGAVFWVRFPLPRTLSRCCGVSSSRN